jgi:hypothetical protein
LNLCILQSTKKLITSIFGLLKFKYHLQFKTKTLQKFKEKQSHNECIKSRQLVTFSAIADSGHLAIEGVWFEMAVHISEHVLDDCSQLDWLYSQCEQLLHLLIYLHSFSNFD